MIDLHSHSTCSDGQLTPQALADYAHEQGVTMMALTDHDNIDGLDSFCSSARALGILPIAGIELSAKFKLQDIHILGLNIKPDEYLLNTIVQQSKARIIRAREISKKLTEASICKDAFESITGEIGHDKIGRLHFAHFLLQQGKVKTLQQAFTRFLGRGKVAYVPTLWVDVSLAVKAIISAGGVAVIAHPLKYGLTSTRLNMLIKDFKEAGGQGLEVVSGDMKTIEANMMAGLCERYELLASSGSDFHGKDISYIKPGRQMKLPQNCQPVWDLWTN